MIVFIVDVAQLQPRKKIMALVTNLSVSRPVALALSSDSNEKTLSFFSQITSMNVPSYFLLASWLLVAG